MNPIPPAALAFLLAAAPVHAEIFRCQDNGRTTYAETPGPSCQSMNIQMTPGDPKEAERMRRQQDDYDAWLEQQTDQIAARDQAIERRREAELKALSLAQAPIIGQRRGYGRGSRRRGAWSGSRW